MIPRSVDGPQAPQPGPGPHLRGDRGADGAHAGLHERQVRLLRGPPRRSGRAPDGANAEGAAEPGAVPAAPGPRGPLAHPHDHPAHRSTRRPIRRSSATGSRSTRSARPRRGIVVRGARILATLAPFADEIAVYPGLPIPAGAERLRAGLRHPGRHARADLPVPGQRLRSGRASLRPAAVLALRRAGRLRDLRRRRGARATACSSTAGSTSTTRIRTSGIVENLTIQTTIRAADQARVRLRPGHAHGGGHQRPEPGHAGDAGRAAELRRGDAQRRARCPPSTAATSATACGSPIPRPLVPMRSLLADVVPARGRDHHADRQPQPPGHAEPAPARRRRRCAR